MTVVVAAPSTHKMTRVHRHPTSSPGNDEFAFRAMDRVLARTFLRELLRRRERQSGGPANAPRTYQPRMDLCDDPASPRVVAMLELPGLKQDDISVRIEDGTLVIQGERRFHNLVHPSASPSPPSALQLHEGNTAGLPRGYHAQEIKYGMFHRTLALPPGTQTEHVQASLSDGMLTVSWPRYPTEVPTTDRYAGEVAE